MTPNNNNNNNNKQKETELWLVQRDVAQDMWGGRELTTSLFTVAGAGVGVCRAIGCRAQGHAATRASVTAAL